MFRMIGTLNFFQLNFKMFTLCSRSSVKWEAYVSNLKMERKKKGRIADLSFFFYHLVQNEKDNFESSLNFLF